MTRLTSGCAFASTGTRRATGTPCLVIVIVSPRATRSGSWGKQVFGSCLLLPPLVARMSCEEALLESEFGERYSDYRRRTWRLLPFLY
jgi:protein-S-isoprenylcysteine O-methyltransferase Ste14